MKNVLRLAKAGGSLAFNVKKVITREKLDWEEGDFFMLEQATNEQFVLTKISMNDGMRKRRLKAQKTVKNQP